MQLDSKTYGIFGAIVVVVALVSFYGGVQYGKSQAISGTPNPVVQGQFGNRDNRQNNQGTNAQRAIRSRGNSAFGEVLAKDAQGITLKTQDGGSKIVFISQTTPVTKSVDGVLDDVKVGTSVMVNGTPNADGSITAQSVQIRPAFVPQPQGQAPQQNGQPSSGQPQGQSQPAQK